MLYLMGLSVPGYMEGRVLEEMLDPRLLESSPVKYGEVRSGSRKARVYSEEEELRILEKLRALGYIS